MEAILEARAVSRDFVGAAARSAGAFTGRSADSADGQDGGIVHALRGVSMTVPRRHLTILRGPSGSGKTTLINILGALDVPTSGSVLLEGVDISAATEGERGRTRRRSLGFVFQSLALVSTMSAFENVEFALRVAGTDTPGRVRRAEDCLARVGLRARMHHRPAELSGGEQQRVAIARAIAHRPRVVFADEPTAELDTHMGLQVMKLFRSLIESEGLTIVMTTHDQGMMELADKVFTLEDGEIVDER